MTAAAVVAAAAAARSEFDLFTAMPIYQSALTHLWREISALVVWIYDTFEDIFGNKHNFTKYLKESCGLGSEQHFCCKYFLKNSPVIALFPK